LLPTISQSTSRILLIAACLLLLVQAVPYFGCRWVEDESWYSIPGYTFLRTGALRNPTFPPTDPESVVDMRPPLMPLSLAFFFRLFGVNPFAARVGELLAALATLPVVYAIAKSLGRPDAGGLAAILVACDNFVFLAARTARPEAWVTLGCAVAVLLLIRSNRTHGALLAFASGVVVGVTCNYHVIPIGCAIGMFLVLLQEEGRSIVRSPRFYSWALGLVLALAPFAIWAVSSPQRLDAFLSMYTRGEHMSIWEKLTQEWSIRVRDFIGISNDRLRLPVPVPLRLHIALMIGLGFLVLYRTKREHFWKLTLLLAPQLLWWLYLVNKSSRYFSAIAPLLALAVALAIVSLPPKGRVFQGAIVVLVICSATQVIGNGFVLKQASTADYPVLSKKLLDSVPPGKTIYGAITFAMAFNSRPYESYDRTPFEYALERERPDYVISGDRVMMRGSGYGEDNSKDLREQTSRFLRSNADLVARVPDPFYGDLEIYRVRD
jgi:4-amino-4-deoxy-L-arabinose transferase-like glycosyltransferase